MKVSRRLITLPARETRRPIRDRRVTAHCCDWWRARVGLCWLLSDSVYRQTRRSCVWSAAFVEHSTDNGLLELGTWDELTTASTWLLVLATAAARQSTRRIYRRIGLRDFVSLSTTRVMDYVRVPSFSLAVRLGKNYVYIGLPNLSLMRAGRNHGLGLESCVDNFYHYRQTHAK